MGLIEKTPRNASLSESSRKHARGIINIYVTTTFAPTLSHFISTPRFAARMHALIGILAAAIASSIVYFWFSSPTLKRDGKPLRYVFSSYVWEGRVIFFQQLIVYKYLSLVIITCLYQKFGPRIMLIFGTKKISRSAAIHRKWNRFPATTRETVCVVYEMWASFWPRNLPNIGSHTAARRGHQWSKELGVRAQEWGDVF